MSERFNIEENKKLKENPFSVPEGYFLQLPSDINIKIRLGADEKISFGLPEGYFEALPNRIMGKIKMEEAGNQNPFITPANYFEELPGRILSQIKLDAIRNKETFSVPDGYFEELSAKISAQVEAEEPKIIRIETFYRRRTVWAVAASIAILFTLGILLMQDHNTQGGNVYLSENTKQEIRENPDQYNIDESSILDAMGVSSDVEETGEDASQYLLESDTDLSSVINEN